MTMNPEVKRLWTTALRSDEFEQGKARLTTLLPDGTEKDCCLGVLCKQAVAAGVIGRRVLGQGEGVAYGVVSGPDSEYDWATGLLPEAVMHWAGLAYINPRVWVEGKMRGLSELNDELGYDFDRIADVIDTGL